MQSSPGHTTSLTDVLNQLIDLEEEQIDSLRATASRIADKEARALLSTFAHAHTQHGAELESLLRKMGGWRTPPAEAQSGFARARVVFAGLVDTGATYGALRDNADDAIAAYRRAIARPLPARVRMVLERTILAHRHRRACFDARETAAHRPHLRSA